MDNFRSELVKSVNEIQEKIKKGVAISDNDLKKILLYSLFEEENNDSF